MPKVGRKRAAEAAADKEEKKKKSKQSSLGFQIPQEPLQIRKDVERYVLAI